MSLEKRERSATPEVQRGGLCTLYPVICQGKKRMAAYWLRVQTAPMVVSAAARQLKVLRSRAGLSIREVAQALGMEHGSSYQHYEDRFKKPYLPLDLIHKLVPIFEPGGVDPTELYALAGVTAGGERPLTPVAGRRAGSDGPMLQIDELDVRAGAG